MKPYDGHIYRLDSLQREMVQRIAVLLCQKEHPQCIILLLGALRSEIGMIHSDIKTCFNQRNVTMIKFYNMNILLLVNIRRSDVF